MSTGLERAPSARYASDIASKLQCTGRVQVLAKKVDSNSSRCVVENDVDADNLELAHYVPRRPASSISEKEANRSHDVYRRVKSVDPNGLRCLVTNSTDCTDVELIPYVGGNILDKDGTTKSNIEWWWGLRKGALDLDTRYNTIPLTASVHSLLEERSWVLLPTMDIVRGYHRTIKLVNDGCVADREKFVTIGNGQFEYDFVAIGLSMARRAIHRQDKFVESPNEENYSAHTYPFRTLPKLISHLHPKYAVLAAGLCVNFLIKRKGAAGAVIERIGNLDERLFLVWDIALAWTAHRPSTAESDSEYTGDSPDEPRPYDIITKSHSELQTPSVRSPV